MAGSREAVTKGLYIGPFAEQKVKAIGLEPPPMMWIFEWDILTGDSAVLDVISSVTGDRIDEAVAEGHEAVAAAERMRTLVAGTDASTWRDPAMREAFLGTLDYEVDTLRLLAEYRELVLRQGAVARHRLGAGPHPVVGRARALPDARGIPPRPLPGRRRPPGLQPHRRRARHRAQRARPGDGLAGARACSRSPSAGWWPARCSRGAAGATAPTLGERRVAGSPPPARGARRRSARG